MGIIPANPKTMSKIKAQGMAKMLGLRAVHKMADSKFHPGATHDGMQVAIKRHNTKFNARKRTSSVFE